MKNDSLVTLVSSLVSERLPLVRFTGKGGALYKAPLPVNQWLSADQCFEDAMLTSDRCFGGRSNSYHASGWREGGFRPVRIVPDAPAGFTPMGAGGRARRQRRVVWAIALLEFRQTNHDLGLERSRATGERRFHSLETDC